HAVSRFLDDVCGRNKRQLYNSHPPKEAADYHILHFGMVVSLALMICQLSVLKIHEMQNVKLLTKGENNAVDDRGLSEQGQHWLEKKDVVERVRGFVPSSGIVTILVNEDPKFKYAVLFCWVSLHCYKLRVLQTD
uniref:Uncharacterized protein n=1 Tax=Sciurus vulgaris TaxID=55149 RepID=A0A8D2AU08_SCIVU